MKILVTGGLGYIGFEVITAASQHPGTRCFSYSRNPCPDWLKLPPHAIHVPGSILDHDRLQTVLDEHEITHIVHAAGARTSDCAADPLEAIESNVLGTDTVFRAAMSTETIQSLLFVSSGAVYGQNDNKIGEDGPIAPTTNYAIAKAAAELAAKGHAAKADFQTTIVRPGFVLGPASSGREPRAKLSHFIQEALTKDHVEMHFAKRFFVHLATDLGANLFGLLLKEPGPEMETFHLPGHPSTLDEFARDLQQVAEEFGRSPELSTSVDTSLKVPEHMGFDYYEERFGPATPPNLKTIIREVIRGLENEA